MGCHGREVEAKVREVEGRQRKQDRWMSPMRSIECRQSRCVDLTLFLLVERIRIPLVAAGADYVNDGQFGVN